jgi:hypothetical protein
MRCKIVLFLPLAFGFGLQNARAQFKISDTLATVKGGMHEIHCLVLNDNGSLSLSFASDSSVQQFHYSNHASDMGQCDIQADRNTPQGSYGPAPIWMDSSNYVTRIKMLVYDGYDWSEQPVWVRIKGGRTPEISFSGPTRSSCSAGSARIPSKILIRRGPEGWVCKVPR